jgi:hypothetical protein
LLEVPLTAGTSFRADGVHIIIFTVLVAVVTIILVLCLLLMLIVVLHEVRSLLVDRKVSQMNELFL